MSAVAPLPTRAPVLGDAVTYPPSTVVYVIVAIADLGDEVHVLAKRADGGMMSRVWLYETRDYLGTRQRWPAAYAHAAWSAHSRDVADEIKRRRGEGRKARPVITDPILFDRKARPQGGEEG